MKSNIYTPKTMAPYDSLIQKYSPTTASFSYTHDRSQKYTSPSQHLNLAKKNIDEAIDLIEDKHNNMSEALRQVYLANSDIIKGMRSQSASAIYKRQQSYTEDRPDYYIADAKSVNQTNFTSLPSPSSKSFQLQARLNQEMRKNNELLYKLRIAEEEKELLRKNGNNQELLRENEKLKNMLRQSSQLPQFLLLQLDELKRQNEQLRQDTVKLLKKGKYEIY